MCLFPLSIRNPTKVVHTLGGQLLRMQVPCGKCADCLKAKRNEWYVRTHYEMMNTFSKGGYVYFDTLTYNDKNLPKLSYYLDIDKYGIKDFSCFNHTHFKLFLKRIRRLISYRYGIKQDAFRYFLTSEYGEDERYTHRPHYHILFFVYANIDPLSFSQLVADCWQYGRTDGFPFKPATYVYKHVYGRDCGFGINNDFTTVTSVCMYVSKYITKSSNFTKKLEKRIALLREKLMYYDAINKPHLLHYTEELLEYLKRDIQPFHRQSNGFGISYLDDLTPSKLMFLNHDKVYIRDKQNVVKTFPLPMYYKRKLYYELCKHDDGTYYWQPTDKGVEHILDVKLRNINSIALKYMDIVRNCTNQSLIDKFFRLLDGRDILDYVVYEQYYKGRHRDINSIDFKNRIQKPLNDHEANLYDWSQLVRLALRPYAHLDSCIQVDEEILRPAILKKEELEKYELDCYKNGHFPQMLNNSRTELLNEYINLYTFNENTDIIFKDYDKISVLITLMSEEQRDNTQITFEYLEDLKCRYKLLFNQNL